MRQCLFFYCMQVRPSDGVVGKEPKVRPCRSRLSCDVVDMSYRQVNWFRHVIGIWKAVVCMEWKNLSVKIGSWNIELLKGLGLFPNMEQCVSPLGPGLVSAESGQLVVGIHKHQEKLDRRHMKALECSQRPSEALGRIGQRKGGKGGGQYYNPWSYVYLPQLFPCWPLYHWLREAVFEISGHRLFPFLAIKDIFIFVARYCGKIRRHDRIERMIICVRLRKQILTITSKSFTVL